jgi:hypothetical protein
MNVNYQAHSEQWRMEASRRVRKDSYQVEKPESCHDRFQGTAEDS